LDLKWDNVIFKKSEKVKKTKRMKILKKNENKEMRGKYGGDK
jgi:hypothetical protein